MASSAAQQDQLAARAGALLVRIGLVALMIALPVAAIYSRRLLHTLMPVGAALILVGALLMPERRLLGKTRKAMLSPPVVAALCFVIWVGLSLLWTPVLEHAAPRYAKAAATLALAFIVIVYMPSRSRTSNLNLLPIGAGATAIATVAVLFAAPAAFTEPPEFEGPTLERAAAGLVLLAWPALAALALRARWGMAGALAVSVAAAVMATGAPAVLAGVAIGGLVVSVATSNPRPLAWGLGGAMAALVLFAPVIPLIYDAVAPIPGVPLTVSKSMAAWADIVRGEPWRLVAGYGLDTLPRGIIAGVLPVEAPRTILFEIWFEHGALGAVTGAAVILTAFLACGRAPPLVAPFMLAGVACVLTIAIWGMATLQLWWLTMVAVMAIGFACTVKGQPRSERPMAPPAATRLFPER